MGARENAMRLRFDASKYRMTAGNEPRRKEESDSRPKENCNEPIAPRLEAPLPSVLMFLERLDWKP